MGYIHTLGHKVAVHISSATSCRVYIAHQFVIILASVEMRRFF